MMKKKSSKAHAIVKGDIYVEMVNSHLVLGDLGANNCGIFQESLVEQKKYIFVIEQKNHAAC